MMLAAIHTLKTSINPSYLNNQFISERTPDLCNEQNRIVPYLHIVRRMNTASVRLGV